MEILIEQVESRHDRAVMRRIRKQVFEVEMGIALSRLEQAEDAPSLSLLAISEPEGKAVATLHVIETTADEALHQRYGLAFDAASRVARFTYLAVLKPYRGLHIPLMLMLEAHRRFVATDHFDFTWLLFEAERAESSFLCRHLAFTPSPDVVRAEYGPCRTLIRDECAPHSEAALQQARAYLAGLMEGRYPGHQASALQPPPLFTAS